MAQQDTFWKRVGGMFRSAQRGPNITHDDRGGGVIKSRSREDESGGEALALRADATSAPWWRRRSARQAQNREMSRQVVEMVGALQQHFEQQNQRSVELRDTLSHVGSVLEQLAETQKSQGDCLQAIARNSEGASKQASQISENLGRVPDALVTQAEAIRTVAKQLEVGQESDTQLMHSMQHFGRAVDALSSSGSAQVEVLQQLNQVQREQHDSLTVLVKEQSKRFVIIVIVAGVLTIAGLAALIVALVVQLGRA